MGGVTLRDVADRCGVSRATVSLVLQDSRRVSEPTKIRIRRALADMGYVYDRRAASLRGQRTSSVGLILTDVRNSALADLAMSFEIGAEEAGFVVMMGYSADSLARQSRILQAMIEYRLDGLVLSPARNTSAADLEPLVRAGLPTVLVTRRIRGTAVNYTGPNHSKGGKVLAEHLASLGVRSVAFLGGSAGVTAREERERGLREELLARGVHWKPRMSIASTAEADGGVLAVQQLLERYPLPDAIVGYSDAVVTGILAELYRRRIQPGKDVAVAGFDNSPAAAHFSPPLTSVDTFMSLVGSKAIEILRKSITDPGHKPVTALLDPKLEVRLSTRDWRGPRK